MQETVPHQAIHVALNTGVEPGQEAGVKAFVRSVNPPLHLCLRFLIPYSSPVGVNPRPENCVFAPIPVELRFQDAERSGRAFEPAHPPVVI